MTSIENNYLYKKSLVTPEAVAGYKKYKDSINPKSSTYDPAVARSAHIQEFRAQLISWRGKRQASETADAERNPPYQSVPTTGLPDDGDSDGSLDEIA